MFDITVHRFPPDVPEYDAFHPQPVAHQIIPRAYIQNQPGKTKVSQGWSSKEEFFRRLRQNLSAIPAVMLRRKSDHEFRYSNTRETPSWNSSHSGIKLSTKYPSLSKS